MAMIRHPVTGVEINVLSVKRPRLLNEAEAETAKLLRADGHKVQDIAAMLGTNPGRIQAVIGKTGKIDGDLDALT